MLSSIEEMDDEDEDDGNDRHKKHKWCARPDHLFIAGACPSAYNI
jgi:hypothetical protein